MFRPVPAKAWASPAHSPRHSASGSAGKPISLGARKWLPLGPLEWLDRLPGGRAPIDGLLFGSWASRALGELPPAGTDPARRPTLPPGVSGHSGQAKTHPEAVADPDRVEVLLGVLEGLWGQCKQGGPAAERSKDALGAGLDLLVALAAAAGPNRRSLGPRAVRLLAGILKDGVSDQTDLKIKATDGLRVLAFELQLVGPALAAGAPAGLEAATASGQPELRAAAAAAIQSLTFHPLGKEAFLDGNLVATLAAAAMATPDVQDGELEAILGALHNLSVLPAALPLLRGAPTLLPGLVALTASELVLDPADGSSVPSSVLGLLQNISRDPAAVTVLRSLDLVGRLVAVLPDLPSVAAQSSALVALLNTMEPAIGGDPTGIRRRSARSALSNLLTLTTIDRLLADEPPQ